MEYEVEFEATLYINVHEDVFKEVLTDEWRSHFYPFETREDVVQHLVVNLLQGHSLTSLDGFAHFPATHATLTKSLDLYSRVAREIPPKAASPKPRMAAR